MRKIREEHAKEVLDPALFEALMEVKNLRGALQLAWFDRQELTRKEVSADLANATKVLRKYGLHGWDM